MSKLDEVLQHHGVKGMKWGVRRDKVTLREKFASSKRERQWRKVLKEADNLSNEELQIVAKRIGLENDLKKLVRESSMASSSDKKDYIRRSNIDDDDLKAKVDRLRAKDNLAKKVDAATKEQRDLGEKLVNAGSAAALTYVKNGKVDGKQLYEALTGGAEKNKNATNDLKKAIKNKAAEQLIKSVLAGAKKAK